MISPIPKSAPTKREALRALLADGAWHHMDELRQVGGWRYGARLLEIRQEHAGVNIEHRSTGADNEFEYRASFEAQAQLSLGAPKKVTSRARIAQLEQEIAELRRRLSEHESRGGMRLNGFAAGVGG